MLILAFLFVYSLGSTALLSFQLQKNQSLRRQLTELPKTFTEEFQVKQFFVRLEEPLKKIYPLLDSLYEQRGRSPVDYHYQFRFLLWWKFFGSPVLEESLETLNSSENLKQVLQCPPIQYTAEIFKGFLKKLTEDIFSQIQLVLLEEIETRIPIDYSELSIDSFPVKSPLNTQKCLAHATLPESSLKAFLDNLELGPVLELLGVSKKATKKVLTKLKVFTVKQVLDIQDWSEVFKLLYNKKDHKAKYSDFYYYNSLQPFRAVENTLRTHAKAKIIEKVLLVAVVSALQYLPEYDAKRKPKSYEDLQKVFHTPHRLKDKGIGLFYCAAKNVYYYGRGALIIVINGIELPLMISLTDKYKQSDLSIQEFLLKTSKRFASRLKSLKLFGDAEFGTLGILSLLNEQLHWNYAIPGYGRSQSKPKLTLEELNKRKTVERVIARLQILWKVENPRLLGKWYAERHVQIACLCDYFQVFFNVELGNTEHIHQYKVIKRKI